MSCDVWINIVGKLQLIELCSNSSASTIVAVLKYGQLKLPTSVSTSRETAFKGYGTVPTAFEHPASPSAGAEASGYSAPESI
jgi:hypothetical protein